MNESANQWENVKAWILWQNGPWTLYASFACQVVIGFGIHGPTTLLGTKFLNIVVWLGPLSLDFQRAIQEST